MSAMMYETLNHKQRAAELRRDASELDRRGYPCLASVNWEMAEWIDPTPRAKPETKTPRRTGRDRETVEITHDESPATTGHTGARPPQRTPRPHTSHRPVPRGTSVINRTTQGRVLRQTDRQVGTR